MSASVRIFCSYSHQDEDALGDLKAHLAEVRRQGLIDDWHDRRIQPGEDWAQSIDTALEASELILLLVTKDFLASEYCNGIELKRGLERAVAGQARVVPVYLRPAYSQGAPFARFQGLPRDAKPIYTAADPDAAWVEVVDGIVRAAREIRGEETPQRGLLASSPGLERPPRLSWIAAAVGLLLTLGFTGWWLLKPDNVRVVGVLTQADSYMNTGRYELALAAFDDALSLEPGNQLADFGRHKAQVFAGMGPDFDVEAARTTLSALERLHPDDAHIQVMLGRLAAAAADTQEARRRYQRALELRPELAQAWFALGVLAHDEGRWEAARAHYEQALALAEHHRQYLTNLAGLLLDQDNYQLALKRYEDLLSVAPGLLLARLDAGNAARLAGQLDKAVWHHERLLQEMVRSGALRHSDNAAQWVFTVPQGELTMDAPATKRHYARLTVALTRWLNGDPPGARQLVGGMSETAELGRVRAALEQDLRRMERSQPQWKAQIASYRQMVDGR